MNEGLRSVARNLQTFLPGGSDTKDSIRRIVRRFRGGLFDDDYSALQGIEWGRAAPLLVDVGANRGQSIEAFRSTVPDPLIVSFEPNPFLAERLARNYRSVPRWTLHQIALTEGSAELTLYVPVYRDYIFDGLASLDREEASGWLTERLFRFNAARLRLLELQVRTAPLDSFYLEPDLIKLDVQGLELEVLKGASRTLKEFHPVLLVESPDDGVVEYLSSYGYEPCFWSGVRLESGVGFRVNTYFF